MNNHADSFKPPHDTGDGMPDGKELFGFVTGICYIAIDTLGAFWMLMMRRGGTIGSRATWFGVGCGNLLLLALRGAYPYTPCYELFTGAMVVMTLLFFYHLIRTVSSKEHVHTQCIGTPMFKGSSGEIGELAGGIFLALIIAFGSPDAQPFAIWLAASAIALAIRGWMIDERDRLRATAMEDAIWEQNYMQRNYERFKKGNQ